MVSVFRVAEPGQAAFLQELVRAGYLLESGVAGVYGRNAGFERVRIAFDEYVNRLIAADEIEEIRFPPVLPRRQLEDTGYLASFPHLVGSVFAFEGSELDAISQHERAGAHEDWSAFQRMTDLVLIPAACYPVYPALAARGAVPDGGITVDTGAAWVFRREPSDDPARQQMFLMRELVRIGEPDDVRSWRDSWRDRSLTVFRDLGLDASFDIGADPFFGRSGRMLANNQRQQELKFEILVPIAGSSATAIASFNYHQDHFTRVHGLLMADGGPAHTACLGFGHERVVLALLRQHGLDLARWPPDVATRLWPNSAQ